MRHRFSAAVLESVVAKRRLCILIPAIFLASSAWAQTSAPVSATIAINTNVTTPISSNFSGANADLGVPIEYYDYRFNSLATALGFGWVRFPGGTSSDIYNWQTGEDVMAWYSEFPESSGVAASDGLAVAAGLGGETLINAANRANFLGASLIVCVNGFTDTPASAGQLAAFVKANNINVSAWELSNEPYLFPTFWATATNYLEAMKPYRDAIKAVLPNAIVAVFASDQAKAGAATDPWNVALAAFTDKYWDAITFHDYPSSSNGPISQWMADENANLAGLGSAISRLIGYGPSGVKILNTEFDPSIPNPANDGSSLTDATVYGGIYSAEYTMRMSASPAVLHVGVDELHDNAGVLSTKDAKSQVLAAAAAGTAFDWLNFGYGYYLSAQGLGLAVLNSVINRAVQANPTTVTGGATVAATGMANIPALYSMSYTNAQGGVSVVVTNKSSTPHQVTVIVNGATAAGRFPIRYVSATDPSTANTSNTSSPVSIQSGTSGNPIAVPAYSVLSAVLTAPPVATFVNSASYQPGPAAPQQLVTAFGSGSGFASQTITASGTTLPTTLGDTSIVITDSRGNSAAAPLYYVSPGQASFLVPSGVASGNATVKVMVSGSTVLTGSLTVASVSPGLYAANGNGAGVAAALAENVSAAGAITPLTVFTCQSGVPLSCLSSPLNVSGSGTVYLSLYATGVRGAQSVQAYVAGQQVSVEFAGAQGQYQGLDQVNVVLPKNLAGMGEVSVYLVADGQTSNMTTVGVH